MRFHVSDAFCRISIHALREEGDARKKLLTLQQVNFYPRPPRGGRLALALDGREILHISIHALREEGDSFADGAHLLHGISIHALREEGDAKGSLSA